MIFPHNPYDDTDQVFIDNLGDRLRTQDNHGTARPIWTVQVKRRRYGIDHFSTDPDGWTLLDESSDPVRDLLAIDDDVVVEEGWEWRPYVWEMVPEPGVVALTEAGIEAHLRQNGHNYKTGGAGGAEKVVESLTRCPELERLIQLAKSGKLRVSP